MKTYEEMAQSVICRAKAHKKARNCWIGSVAAILVLGLSVGIMVTNASADDPSLQTPPAVTLSDEMEITPCPTGGSLVQTLPSQEIMKGRVTLLYAEGEKLSEMTEGVSIPCKSQLRVVDVTGMTDAEINAVAEAEKDYANGVIGSDTQNRGYGWEQYNPAGGTIDESNHLLATFIYVGNFVIKTDDVSQIRNVRVATGNSTFVLPAFCSEQEKECCMPFVYPMTRDYIIDGELLQQWYYQPYGGIEIDLGLGNGVMRYLNQNDPLPLSQLSETMTFLVTYVDGATEAYTVDMLINESGEIHTLCRGITAAA